MYKFGVDVGGTTVKIGLFSGDGKLEEKYEIATDKSDQGAHIIAVSYTHLTLPTTSRV